MENLKIRGRQFRNALDYAAGRRDDRRIERIEAELDRNSLAQVTKLRQDLQAKLLHFETMIGEDYLDEISELEVQLKVKSEMEAAEKAKNRFKITNKFGQKTKKSKKSKPDKKSKVNVSIEEELESYDPALRQQIVKEFRRNELKRRLYLFALGICVLISVGYLAFYYTLYAKNDTEYKELQQLVVKDSGVKINLSDNPEAPPILEKYATLYQKNRKIVGWLFIEGCNIDYPVMQTSDNDYYLDHNYNQEYDKNGSIFMDMNCTPDFPNDNMIIYGHHMKSGKMFGNLNRYSRKEFFEKNPLIYFDTIYEEGIYQVMYVFRSQIYAEEDIVFKYYKFIDAASPDEFYSSMESMAELSLYDTGVTAAYGDKLITLSTCDSAAGTTGRFVVVAKKIK